MKNRQHTTTFFLLLLFPVLLVGQQYRLVDSSGGLQWSSVSSAISQQISMFVRQGDTIFAAHGGLGAIYSTDDGETWQRSGMTQPIQAIATNGSRLYSVSDGKPYYSNNAGASWIRAGYVDSTLGNYIRCMIVARGNDALLLCIYEDRRTQEYYSRLFVSRNGGSIWKVQSTIPRYCDNLVSLGDILFAKTSDAASNILCSRDMGKTWIPQPRFSDNIVNLYSHGASLYITTAPYQSNQGTRAIFISSDSAKTWKRCADLPDITFLVPIPATPEQRGNSQLPFNIQQGRWPIESISVSDNGQITVCLMNSLIYSSVDNGSSWKLVNSYLWKARAYFASKVFTTNTSIIISGRGGIFRCSTEGENMHNVCASSFYDRYWFSPCNSDYALFPAVGVRKKTYFMSGYAGLFRSSDGWIWQQILPKMYNWKATNPIDPFEFVHPIQSKGYFTSLQQNDYCINALAGDDNSIVAFTKDGTILRSRDNGTTWLPVMQDRRFIAEKALLIRQESTFIAFINGSAFRSTNDGTTWQEISSLKELGIKGEITSVAANTSAIFATTQQDVIRSLDGGLKWSKHTVSLDIRSIRNIASAQTVIYVATEQGIFRSLDNGSSWEITNEGIVWTNNKEFTTSVLAIKNIAVSMVDGNATFFSPDFGNRWHRTGDYNSFYSPFSTTFESVRTLATNNISILGLTKENTLYQTDIPSHLGSSIYDVDTAHSSVTAAPNPSNGVVNLGWTQKFFEYVSIGIYDSFGRCVGGFSHHEYMSGRHQYIWDASTMPTGVYFYRYTIGEKIHSGNVIVTH
jgi:photosystem II stability/assembly factor-like uncharacterized protein